MIPLLSEYMLSVWEHDGGNLCDHCEGPIYYDRDSGFWIHAGHAQVDGHNGLHCSSGMWDGSVDKKYAIPLRPVRRPRLSPLL